MKKITLIFLLLPLLSTAQWAQIGSDIDGEQIADLSGTSISLSSDGDVLAIGAPTNDGNGNDSGHVRVYKNVGVLWTQIGQDIDGEMLGDSSGWSVSLSSDGSIVAVGATGSDGNGSNSGHVRVYENQTGTWVQIGQDIDGESSSDYSGTSISLSSDGSIVAIGAHQNDGNGLSSGHVRVYENQTGTWVKVGADIDGESSSDWFGRSVSLNSDGSMIVIGAHGDDGSSETGYARVFENQSGSWIQIGQDIEGEAQYDSFGYSVCINSDGSVVAIGGYENDGAGSEAGHVRIYENQSGAWIQLGLDIDGEAEGDESGKAISLSADGSRVAISGHKNDGTGTWAGHVRVFNGSSLLSVEENSFGVNFSMYPNPSYGISKVQLGDVYDKVEIKVLNQLGVLVDSLEYTNSSKLELNTQRYSTGVYLIHIQSSEKKAIIKLIVK